MTKRNSHKHTTFFQRHHRVLTFTGALIVFMTFVIKDGKQDKLKDSLYSLTSFSNLLALEQDNEFTTAGLNDIYEAITMTQGNPGPDTIQEHNKRSFVVIRNTLVRRIARLDYTLRESGRFADSQNLPSPIRNDFVDLAVRLGKLQLDPAYSRYDDQLSVNTMLATPATNFSSMERDVHSLLLPTLVLEFDLTRLTKKVIASARERTEQTERTLKIYSIASYVLYVLGWSIGLLGRLYGDKEDETMEQ